MRAQILIEFEVFLGTLPPKPSTHQTLYGVYEAFQD